MIKPSYKDIIKINRLKALRKQEEKTAQKKDNNTNIRIAYKIGELWCLANYYNTEKIVFLSYNGIVKYCASKGYTLRRKENKDIFFKERAYRTYSL
jgi:hypothetical protein